jgi:hypothetical protein
MEKRKKWRNEKKWNEPVQIRFYFLATKFGCICFSRSNRVRKCTHPTLTTCPHVCMILPIARRVISGFETISDQQIMFSHPITIFDQKICPFEKEKKLYKRKESLQICDCEIRVLQYWVFLSWGNFALVF